MDKRNILFIVLLAVTFYAMQFIFKPPQKETSNQVIQEKTIAEEQPALRSKKISQQTGKEAFYVLENDFQMLVFSTKGGALAEINLPFRSKENTKSIINEIGFDKKIAENSQRNAFFPMNPYYVYSDKGPILKEKGTLSGYNPLIRREIAGLDMPNISQYYSLNIISDYENISDLNYEVTRFEKNLIEFELNQSNRRIVKTYKFADDAPYTFDLSITVDGDSKNLWLSTGVPEVELTSGRNDPVLKMKLSRKQKNVVEKLKLPKTENVVTTIYPDWMCNSNGFMGIIVDPLNEIAPGYKSKYIPGDKFPSRLTLIDSQYNVYPANKYPGYEIFLPMKHIAQKTNFRIFAGPFAKNMLASIDDVYSNAITGYNPEYSQARSFHGWFAFLSEPFAKLMFLLMQLFHKITYSWGLSIILLTLALRIMLYPLNAWAIKSQLKMQELGPKMEAVKKRFANNPQKAKLEIMQLYRTHKINPLMGCFPILIQMPFLIGMFDLLKSTFELRGASFIPGWINNLAAPDVVFSWSRPIPIIGTEFHLLPILLGVVMFLQSKFAASKKNKTSEMTDQQRQQQAMSTILPIIFCVFFYKMPSGLNLYFMFSTIFGVVQQWYTNKTIKSKMGVNAVKKR